MQKRMDIKWMRYLGIDTQGEGTFTARAYIDNLYQDALGVDTPLLTLQFVGGDAQGYGIQPYGGTPYGGGRRTSEERLYAFPIKYKLLKLRFSGAVIQPLRFVSISVAYLMGSIRR